MNTVPTNDEQLRAEVSARYARTALQVLGNEQPAMSNPCCGPTCCTPTTTVATPIESRKALPVVEAEQGAGCCGPSCCSTDTRDASVITSDLYTQAELGTIPVAAALASLGCGNPTALAELKSGERVLDLGSGGGIDVLLSARRVGPTGFAYGLDMADAMLELAERNRAEAELENVRFLKGIIEDIPLPAESVDVVISNCVINLSADKARVIRETARVLKPGGRVAVSDVIADPDMDAATRADMQQYVGCIAGALTRDEYADHLAAAGLAEIEITETHRVHAHAGSAIIRARKPA